MIPPVGFTDVGLEVVGRFPDYDARRSDNRSDGKEDGEYRYYDAESLDQVEIGNLHGLGGAYPEND